MNLVHYPQVWILSGYHQDTSGYLYLHHQLMNHFCLVLWCLIHSDFTRDNNLHSFSGDLRIHMATWQAHKITRWHTITYCAKYVYFSCQLLGEADYAKHHSCLAGEDFRFPSQDHSWWYLWTCETLGLRDGPSQGGKGGTRQEKEKGVCDHQKFWFEVGFGKGQILLYAGVGLEGQAGLPLKLVGPLMLYLWGLYLVGPLMHRAWKKQKTWHGSWCFLLPSPSPLALGCFCWEPIKQRHGL